MKTIRIIELENDFFGGFIEINQWTKSERDKNINVIITHTKDSFSTIEEYENVCEMFCDEIYSDEEINDSIQSFLSLSKFKYLGEKAYECMGKMNEMILENDFIEYRINEMKGYPLDICFSDLEIEMRKWIDNL